MGPLVTSWTCQCSAFAPPLPPPPPNAQPAMSNVAKADKEFDSAAPAVKTHRIRITLTSRNVKALEKVCSDLVNRSKDKDLRVKGPVRLPTKRLHIVTRKTPCGEGSKTWDHLDVDRVGSRGRGHHPELSVSCHSLGTLSPLDPPPLRLASRLASRPCVQLRCIRFPTGFPFLQRRIELVLRRL